MNVRRELLATNSSPPAHTPMPAHEPASADGQPLGSARRRRRLAVLAGGILLMGLSGFYFYHEILKNAARFQTGAVTASPVVDENADMVRLPAGQFQMGSPENEPERDNDEGPQHWVEVPAFEIGRHEVTFVQWNDCVSAGGCTYKPKDAGWGRGQRPVINVSWNDAQQYVRWLSGKTGQRWRLPTEAEWEYAARAGSATPFSGGRCMTTRQANYDGNYDYNECGAKSGKSMLRTQPVGSYPPNAWGLYDIHGNVWEWVEDCWHDGYTGTPTDGSAWTPQPCLARVLRGGAWDVVPRGLRCADRWWVDPGSRGDSAGFRVARTLPP